MEDCNKYNSVANEVNIMEIKKVLAILIIFILVILLVGNTVQAFSVNDLTGTESDAQEIKTVGNKVIQVISVVGSILSVIVIIVLGIKYMVGSVEERAEHKKTMIPYIIGAVLLFAASSVVGIIANIVQNMNM